MVTKNLTSHALNSLLARFSEDERQSAAHYTALRDSLVRFFELKGDAEPETAADETLDRTALKVAADTPIDDVKKYSFGVARLIFLERRRFSKKEQLAAADFYGRDKISTASIENAETDDFHFLRECFESLSSAERAFLQTYFADLPAAKLTEQRRRLTVEKEISLNQMRVKVSRLRKRLENCVRARRKKKTVE